MSKPKPKSVHFKMQQQQPEPDPEYYERVKEKSEILARAVKDLINAIKKHTGLYLDLPEHEFYERIAHIHYVINRLNQGFGTELRLPVMQKEKEKEKEKTAKHVYY